MNTPFGPAINLGTLDNPNYAGAAGGVAYLRGIHTAFQVLKDLDIDGSWDPYRAQGRCIEAVEALLPSTPDSAPGRDPNLPAAITSPTYVANGNTPQRKQIAHVESVLRPQ